MRALDAPSARQYDGYVARISVDLSSELQHHLDARAAAGRFADSASYLRALAERDRDAYRADVARVQALIDEGIASGVCEKDAFAVLDEIIAGIREPHG